MKEKSTHWENNRTLGELNHPINSFEKKDVQVKVDHLPSESHVHFFGINISRNILCGTTKEYISSGQIGKHFPEVGSGITWDYPMWMDTDPGNSCHKMRTWVSSHIFVILLMFPSFSPISRSTSLSEPYGSRITPTKFSEIHLPVFAYKNQPSHPTTGFSWICSLTSKLAAR